jgi:WD40 repeat protein
MNHIFISYSREDREFTQKLIKKLESKNKSVWVDTDDLYASAIWWDELQNAIMESIAYIYLVSKNSLNSEYCKKEYLLASEKHKKIIPILLPGYSEKDIPKNIDIYQWVKWDDLETEDGLSKLISDINTDYEWRKFNTDLDVKASQWEKDKDMSLLLHGEALRKVEKKIAERGNEKPQINKLNQEYISKSRKSENQKRRLSSVVGAIILIILLFISLLAIYQTNIAATSQSNAMSENQNAIEQAKISRATNLAFQSTEIRYTQFNLSLLLSVEAFLIKDLPITRKTLYESTQDEIQLIRYLSGHTKPVRKVAFSPDGKTLASGGDDGNLAIWDTQTNTMLWSVEVNESPSPINQIVYSPNSKIVVINTEGSDEQFWDLRSHENITPHLSHENDYSFTTSFVFSKDGKFFALGDFSGGIYIWDTNNNYHPVAELFTEHTETINSLAFSPDGKILASGDETGHIVLWNTETYKPLGKLLGHTKSISSLAFSPDGIILASSGWDTAIILWNTVSYEPIGRSINEIAETLAFSPDGKILAYENNGSVVFIDVTTHQSFLEFNDGNSGIVTSSALSPDWKELAVGNGDNTISVWNLTPLPQHRNFSYQTGSIDAIYNPDGKVIASGGWGKTIYIWDSESQNSKQTQIVLTKTITNIVLSPDGKMLSASDESGTITMWDINNYHPIKRWTSDQNTQIESLAFSPDGKMLASGVDNTVILLDVKNGNRIGQTLTTAAVEHVLFNPSGKSIAVSNRAGIITIWDIETQQQISRINTGISSTNNLIYSLDGKTLAFTKWEDIENLVLWDIESNQEMNRFSLGIDVGANGLALSPDGKMIATVLSNSDIVLWDTATHQQIAIFSNNTITSKLVFSPDGKELASSACSKANEQELCILGETNIWGVSPQIWIENSCQRAGRNFTRAEWAQYFPAEEYRTTCPQWPIGVGSTATP